MKTRHSDTGRASVLAGRKALNPTRQKRLMDSDHLTIRGVKAHEKMLPRQTGTTSAPGMLVTPVRTVLPFEKKMAEEAA